MYFDGELHPEKYEIPGKSVVTVAQDRVFAGVSVREFVVRLILIAG